MYAIRSYYGRAMVMNISDIGAMGGEPLPGVTVIVKGTTIGISYNFV